MDDKNKYGLTAPINEGSQQENGVGQNEKNADTNAPAQKDTRMFVTGQIYAAHIQKSLQAHQAAEDLAPTATAELKNKEAAATQNIQNPPQKSPPPVENKPLSATQQLPNLSGGPHGTKNIYTAPNKRSLTDTQQLPVLTPSQLQNTQVIYTALTNRPPPALSSSAKRKRKQKLQQSQKFASQKATYSADNGRNPLDNRPQYSLNPVLHGIGNMLYSLGFAFEYYMVRIWRVVKDVFLLAAQLIVWFTISAAMAVANVSKGFWQDAKAPFLRYQKRRRQIKRLHKRARERAKRGAGKKGVTLWGAALKEFVMVMGYMAIGLLPLAAAACLVITVYSVTNTNYALAVELNGEILGYVTDQNVVESAKGLLRERISLAENQEVSDWQINPTYTISYTDELTTVPQLVNAILLSGSENPSDLVQGTGLYVEGELLAVTTEGDRLRAYLDERLSEYQNADSPDAVVEFTADVQCNPESNEVFFASSVKGYDELIATLSQTVAEEVTHTSDGTLSLDEIAQQYGLTLDILQARNPEWAQSGGNAHPDEGEVLLIQREQEFLQVQTRERVQSTEEIPFATVEVETEELAVGQRAISQQGVNGQQEVWDDYIYINGELQSISRVNELTVVLSEPIEQIVEVGTYAFGDIPTSTFGDYLFPVPSSTYASRNASSYHRGMDIVGDVGTPIFASNEGLVTTAGWHYSYGNYIVIEHPDGIETLYAHCSSLAVEAGQHVMRGEYIAAMGSTGNSTGSHLHLEILINGQYVDPLLYVVPPEGFYMPWLQ